MNSALIFDLAVVAIALVAGLSGIIAGLVRELAGLCGILVGVYLSTKYADDLGQILLKYGVQTENHTLLKLLGFLIILIVIWAAFIILGKVVSKALKLSGLGLFDRIFGFIFGAGKFVIIASVIAGCINTVPFLNKYVNDYLSESQSWPVLINIGSQIANTNQLSGLTDTLKNNSQSQRS